MRPYSYIEMIRVCCGYSVIFSVASIVLERVIATLYIDRYERTDHHPYLIALTIVFIWLFGIVSCALSYGRPHASPFTLVGLTLSNLICVSVGQLHTNQLNHQLFRVTFLQFVSIRGVWGAQTASNTHWVKGNFIKIWSVLLKAFRFQLQENLRVFGILKKAVKFFVPTVLFVGSLWATFGALYYFHRSAVGYPICSIDISPFLVSILPYAWNNASNFVFGCKRRPLRLLNWHPFLDTRVELYYSMYLWTI